MPSTWPRWTAWTMRDAIPAPYEHGRHDDWDHSPVNPGYL